MAIAIKIYKANQNKMSSSGFLGNINTLRHDSYIVSVHYNIVFNRREILQYEWVIALNSNTCALSLKSTEGISQKTP